MEDIEEDLSISYGDEGGDDAVGTRVHEKAERKSLARNESRAVVCWRFVVYFVVLLVAVLVSYAVHQYTKSDQQEDFEVQFAAFATKVTESFYTSVERKLGAIQTLSSSITSHAISSGASFPNVTIPDMDIQGTHTRIQAAGSLIYWMPLVTDETRAGWEVYAKSNRHWMMDAFVKEMGWKTEQDARFGLLPDEQTVPEEDQKGGRRNLEEETDEFVQVEEEDGYKNFIFGGNGTNPRPIGSGPFLPLWQLSPVVPMMPFLNYDLLTNPAVKDTFQAVIDSQQVVIGKAHNLMDPSNTSAGLYNAFLASGQYRHNTKTYQGDPTTNLVVPVFDQFGPNRTLGGLLHTSLYFRLNFVDILPDTAKGVICVMKNSLNQSFTYQLDGPEATFLGPGDRHNPKYDHMVVSEDVMEHIESRASPENQGFDSTGMNQDHCRYQLFVYPSQATEDEYVNTTPLLYTLLVASVFLFTSLIFIAYDCLVARRQEVVMKKAVRSSAIVSSLYPEQVRDRLYHEETSKTMSKSDAWNNNDKEIPLDKLASMDESAVHAPAGRPIADSYEECTVLFADIAGFTKWSSSRKPEEVFFLLETLYQAFDKIAVRRKVFKVETIGDCYVAVTGLPDSQPNHAMIMVKFARDCYSKLNSLLPSLAEKLGEDTAQLNFRVGLHSGSVTGGVLRGQKSRFQLFGDTINTASRMESNGVPGRIHISQTTADELRAMGWGKFVEPREDKIVAKGKGELQTYFVSIQQQVKSLRSSISISSTVDSTDRSGHFRLMPSEDEPAIACEVSSLSADRDKGPVPPLTDVEI